MRRAFQTALITDRRLLNGSLTLSSRTGETRTARLTTPLRTARVPQLAGQPLALAPSAGRRNEDPVGERHSNEQRSDAFQQLPTCTHTACCRFWNGCSCYPLQGGGASAFIGERESSRKPRNRPAPARGLFRTGRGRRQDKAGGRACRDRTYDQRIKSPLLYQLS